MLLRALGIGCGGRRPRGCAPAGVLALTLVALAAPDAGARAGESPHPLLGTWKVVLADGICAETYQFRADGTARVTSGAEVSERDYEVAPTASPLGFYKLVDRITRDNGKRDCQGELLGVGQQTITYVRIHPAGDMLLFCDRESRDSCVGPLNRIPDPGL